MLTVCVVVIHCIFTVNDLGFFYIQDTEDSAAVCLALPPKRRKRAPGKNVVEWDSERDLAQRNRPNIIMRTHSRPCQLRATSKAT